LQQGRSRSGLDPDPDSIEAAEKWRMVHPTA
jgi:hypothetical protein